MPKLQFDPARVSTRRPQSPWPLAMFVALVVVALAAYLASRSLVSSARPTAPNPSAATSSPSSAHKSTTSPAKVDPAESSAAVDRERPAVAPPARLQRLAGDRYRTPAGLIFGPSRGEHRLEHVMRHARDDPGRSGPHGVFDLQTQDEIAGLIDEAYAIAQNEPRRAVIRRDDERTIYTVQMNRRVGYVGGSAGRAANHPPCRRMTLVLEGLDVITAYPVR